MFETTIAIVRCPSCGKLQCPYYALNESYRCRHCGHIAHRREWRGQRFGERTVDDRAIERRRDYMARYNAEHADQIRASKRRYYRSAKGKAKRREYYEKNRERILERSKEYRQANKERCTRRGNDWKRANPGKVKGYRYKRYLRLKGDPCDPAHGSGYGYQLGCRCERCKKAKSEYDRKSRERRKRDKVA